MLAGFGQVILSPGHLELSLCLMVNYSVWYVLFNLVAVCFIHEVIHVSCVGT